MTNEDPIRLSDHRQSFIRKRLRRRTKIFRSDDGQDVVLAHRKGLGWYVPRFERLIQQLEEEYGDDTNS